LQNLFYGRRIIIVPSVNLDSKVSVGAIINWTSFSTDDVCNGNKTPLSSRHTEDCHLQCYNFMCHGTDVGFTALHTTVPRVLADSLLHYFFPCYGRDLKHIQHYVSESVQSCEASKQLLQGEKQQQFYVRVNFIKLCTFLFSNPVCFYIFLGKLLYLSLSSPLIIS
jgi:hypothetical protein